MDLWVFENQIYTKIILLWQIPNVLPKSSCMGTLVLKSGFFRFYAPLRIPSKRNAAKPCCKHGFLLVKFWNCQSYITFKVFLCPYIK